MVPRARAPSPLSPCGGRAPGPRDAVWLALADGGKCSRPTTSEQKLPVDGSGWLASCSSLCLRNGLTLTLTCTHTHAHTLTRTHSHSHTLTFSHTHRHTRTLTLMHSHILSLTLTLTLTNSHSHTLTHSHSLTHTHTHELLLRPEWEAQRGRPWRRGGRANRPQGQREVARLLPAPRGTRATSPWGSGPHRPFLDTTGLGGKARVCRRTSPRHRAARLAASLEPAPGRVGSGPRPARPDPQSHGPLRAAPSASGFPPWQPKAPP